MESDVIFSRLKIWCKRFRSQIQISDIVLLCTIFSKITQNTKKRKCSYVHTITNQLKYVTLLQSLTSGRSGTESVLKVL